MNEPENRDIISLVIVQRFFILEIIFPLPLLAE